MSEEAQGIGGPTVAVLAWLPGALPHVPQIPPQEEGKWDPG